MGDALSGACADLAARLTLERCDQLILRLNGAEAGVRQFRQALIADQDLASDTD
jgi:hypothetical protein